MTESDRRSWPRYTMALPIAVRSSGPGGIVEQRGKTRDINWRGLYFWTEADFQPGAEIEFTLTLPKEVTKAADVNIKCTGRIIRVDPHAAGRTDRGIAAQIEHYEFLPAA